MIHQINAQFTCIQSSLVKMREGITQASSLIKSINALIEIDNADGETISSILQASELVFDQINKSFEGIYEWCYDMDMQRIDREVAVADLTDSDEGQALRNLSRDLARQIEDVCAPAMQAITKMQNSAGEIDTMIQRARDMAGCYRPIHSPDRDADRPEAGSLCATIGETMDPRTVRFAAAIERARARLRGERDEAA